MGAIPIEYGGVEAACFSDGFQKSRSVKMAMLQDQQNVTLVVQRSIYALRHLPCCFSNFCVENQCGTLDGRNPAPVDMVNIPLFIGVSYIPGGAGFQPSTVRSI